MAHVGEESYQHTSCRTLYRKSNWDDKWLHPCCFLVLPLSDLIIRCLFVYLQCITKALDVLCVLVDCSMVNRRKWTLQLCSDSFVSISDNSMGFLIPADKSGLRFPHHNLPSWSQKLCRSGAGQSRTRHTEPPAAAEPAAGAWAIPTSAADSQRTHRPLSHLFNKDLL